MSRIELIKHVFSCKFEVAIVFERRFANFYHQIDDSEPCCHAFKCKRFKCLSMWPTETSAIIQVKRKRMFA